MDIVLYALATIGAIVFIKYTYKFFNDVLPELIKIIKEAWFLRKIKPKFEEDQVVEVKKKPGEHWNIEEVKYAYNGENKLEYVYFLNQIDDSPILIGMSDYFFESEIQPLKAIRREQNIDKLLDD